MTSLSIFVLFFGVAFILALSPGPNLIYLISRTIFQGRAAGFCSLMGVACGMLFYLFATAAGLSALFATVPIAYDVVRLVGAAYMMWLAIKIVTSSNTSFGNNSLTSVSRSSLFRTGMITCLLNPKIALTYGALLPQFVQPEMGNITMQLVVLGIVQITGSVLAHGLVILLASSFAARLNECSAWLKYQRYLMGTVLVAIAANLAFERRAS